MRTGRTVSVAASCAFLCNACVSLAPGAENVRLTRNASDVATCTAVGNVNASGGVQGPSQIVDASTEFRNQALGLGGNVVYVTLATLGVPDEGVVYRCP